MSLTPLALERFAATLACTPERWRHLVRHTGDARVYDQIWDGDEANAWVICWSEGQDTGYHDHDVSGAAIAVVSGAVREDRLTIGARPVSRLLRPGTAVHVPPVAIHRILHVGLVPAASIHAYSPPLTRTGTYRIGGRRTRARVAVLGA
jgi:hypothetical protein